MPEFKTWIILALLVFAWIQYTYPEKVQGVGDATFGKLNEFVKLRGKAKVEETKESICPESIDEVCGSDGVTYLNSCKAVLAGVFEVTPGKCPDE